MYTRAIHSKFNLFQRKRYVLSWCPKYVEALRFDIVRVFCVEGSRKLICENSLNSV